jgi:hypothetical protein
VLQTTSASAVSTSCWTAPRRSAWARKLHLSLCNLVGCGPQYEIVVCVLVPLCHCLSALRECGWCMSSSAFCFAFCFNPRRMVWSSNVSFWFGMRCIQSPLGLIYVFRKIMHVPYKAPERPKIGALKAPLLEGRGKRRTGAREGLGVRNSG